MSRVSGSFRQTKSRPFVRRDGGLACSSRARKQLIDVDGKRVVRVNDVQLIEAAGDWRVTGVDVSLQGLWRRLAPAGFMGTRNPVEVLDWADVGYLATDAATVQLKSSSGTGPLHPVRSRGSPKRLLPSRLRSGGVARR